MTSVQLVQRAAWVSLSLCIAMFVAAVFLARVYLCQPHGPIAFAVSLLLCATAFLLLLVSAFQRRSIAAAGGAIAVALLGGAMFFASIGLTMPGCSGV